MYLRARWVFPITKPPIENGAVVVEGDRIVYVGKNPPNPPLQKGGKGGFIDLGDSILLPGLVNVHCHLEFRSPSPPPLPQRERETVNFTEWVKEMQNPPPPPFSKGGFSFDRLLQTGTTTVADHCNPGTPRIDTPFRRIIFWEVLGAAKDRAEASFKQAQQRSVSEGGFITPHSFYAVHKDVSCRFPSSLQSIHLLESSDEDECLRHGTGPLADYVKERGGSISSSANLLQYVPSRSLLIHGNYLNSPEIGALRDSNASVIHCPGSHRFFGHRRFPLEELKRAGVRIALGTDSLASNEALSMLREMRLLKKSYPELDEAEILKMATIEGARALGMEKEIGSIEVGKKADLIAVSGSVLEAKQVAFSMINGKLCLNP